MWWSKDATRDRRRGSLVRLVLLTVVVSHCWQSQHRSAHGTLEGKSYAFIAPRQLGSQNRGARPVHTGRSAEGGTKSGSSSKDTANSMEDLEAALAAFEGVVDTQLQNLKVVADSETAKKIGSIVGEERFESIKTVILALVSAVLPEAVFGWLDPDRLTPRWEFQLDVLAFQVVLFALVYRYAIREGDNNPMQQLGVIAAFVIPRAFFMVELTQPCLPGAFTCGPNWVNPPVLLQVTKNLLVGGATIGGAAYGLERAFKAQVIRRFSSSTSSEEQKADFP